MKKLMGCWVLLSGAFLVRAQSSVVHGFTHFPAGFSVGRTGGWDARDLLYEPALQLGFEGWVFSAGQQMFWQGAGLNERQAAVAGNSRGRSFFAGAGILGNEDLNISRLQGGMGRRMGQHWSMGICLGYRHARAAGVNGRGWPEYKVGLKWLPSSLVELTTTLENPWLPLDGMKPAVAVRNGIQLRPSEVIQFKILLITEQDRAAVLFTGLQYCPDKMVWARLGWLTGQSVLIAGFGLRYKNWAFESGTWFQADMGFSPSFAVHFNKLKP